MTRTLDEIMNDLPEDRRNAIVQYKNNINKLINMNAKLQYIISHAPHESVNDECVEWKKSKEYYFEVAYRYIFSQEFSIWIISTFPKIKDCWYDPDTSYEEDVCAFGRALREFVKYNFQEDIDDYFEQLFR